MVDTRDECVHCGLPCLGNACPNRSVTHYICNECGDEKDPEELLWAARFIDWKHPEYVVELGQYLKEQTVQKMSV